MEELALTMMEIIHANAKMDGQAIIVTKKSVLGTNVLVIEGQKLKPNLGILVYRGRKLACLNWMKITVETPMEF